MDGEGGDDNYHKVCGDNDMLGWMVMIMSSVKFVCLLADVLRSLHCAKPPLPPLQKDTLDKTRRLFKKIFQREKKIICCLWAKSWSGLNLGAGAKQASTLLQASGNMRVRIQSKMERGEGVVVWG